MLTLGFPHPHDMSYNTAVTRYVQATTVFSLVVLCVGYMLPGPPPDLWTLLMVFGVGTFVELSRTHNKEGGATGSLGFVIHLGVGLVVGAFWGGIVAGLSKVLADIYNRNTGLRTAFNAAERVASVGLTFILYYNLGGKHPPAFLDPTIASPTLALALSELLIFFASALVYFLVNSLSVSAAMALANERPVISTWRRTAFWVLGYDLIASSMAIGAAWLFISSATSDGLRKLLPLAIVIPFAVAKHLYGKLNTLQDVVKELDEAYAELELNVREQLEMMVKAIEARDPYTSGHSRRVCGLSRAIAIDMGLSDKEVEDIENAALLHDVGKIYAEFASILQKEGRLTDEEWEVMKTHSIKSAELVANFSRFRGYIVDCIRHHHERWDGRGYPDGIKGEEIPLGARIITIADTIDAMTTNRPYRGALSLDVVISELNKGRGSQFQEELVEVTVNSVTVRRLISDPGSSPEYIPSHKRMRRPEQSHPFIPSPVRLGGSRNGQ